MPAVRRIADIAELPAGLDGEDAAAPAPVAIGHALELLLHVSSLGIDGEKIGPPWTSAPIADGGLQLEWQAPGARIEVQVAPDGTFGFLSIIESPGGRQ
jgi:hypothetical protein